MGITPLKIIAGTFLVLLLVCSIIPLYSLRLNPEPKSIPGIEAIPDFSPRFQNRSVSIYEMIEPDNAVVKLVATRIASQSCPSESKSCQAKAIYYFVRDNIQYVSDPGEYYQYPDETLYSLGGDCDDMAILLVSMEQAIGVQSKLVFAPNHVYAKVSIPKNMLSSSSNKWIDVDPTCKECKFGHLAQFLQ